MKSLLSVLLLIVLQGTCSSLRFTHSRYILSRFSINSSINPKTTSSYYSGTSSDSRNVQSYPALNNRAGRPNKSEVWMSTAFDEFRRKAEDILPEHTDNETTSRVAFHLMQTESENEKKQMQSENEKKQMQLENEKKLEKKDNEKKLEVLEIKMEMEKKLELQELKKKLELQKMESDNKQRRLRSIRNSSVQWRRGWSFICLYASWIFSFFFSRHLPHHFFASSVFRFHTDKFSRAF